MRMLNIFAYRATDPLVMRLAEDPIGPQNDRHILENCKQSQLVVAAWGMHGMYRNRQQEVLRLLAEVKVHCLGVTKSGCPRHPLYLRSSTVAHPWLRG
jgi:hypothetical protein